MAKELMFMLIKILILDGGCLVKNKEKVHTYTVKVV